MAHLRAWYGSFPPAYAPHHKKATPQPTDPLVQAGTDAIATATPQYRFWTEDYPNLAVFEGLIVRPGDTVYVSEEYPGSLSNNSGRTATFWLENETTGNYSSFTNSAPYPGWRAANFINEMALFIYLPDFGSNVFSNCATNDNNGNYWYLYTSNNNRVYMTTNGTSSGTIMSDPGAVNNSTSGFTDIWKNNTLSRSPGHGRGESCLRPIWAITRIAPPASRHLYGETV